MKIVKEFEDKEFAKSRSYAIFYKTGEANWHWGLGDDGELYVKGSVSGYISGNTWHPYHQTCVSGLTMAELKRIYEAFVKPEPKGCVCDIQVLMTAGCKCGRGK